MLIDAILLLGNAGLWILIGVLGFLPSLFPTNIADAITYFVAHFSYLQGIIDINTLFTAVGAYITFYIFFLTFKLILSVIKFIPIVGKIGNVFNVGQKSETEEQREDKKLDEIVKRAEGTAKINYRNYR